MEKDSPEMDLEDWEILPSDGYWSTGSDPKRVVDVDYLPSLISPQKLKTPGGDGNQLIPMGKIPQEDFADEIGDMPAVENGVVQQKMISPNSEAGQDAISQIVSNKAKKNEFVDMKADFPKSNNRDLKPQSEVGQSQFKENEEDHEQAENKQPKAVTEQENRKNYTGSEIKDKGFWEGCSLNIWKWRVPGIGAVCSIGVAAATICVVIFGSNQRSKQHQNQNLQFQICNDDKSMNQAVHHAARLNQAISATRGVPLTRARFTTGGSYVSH